MGLGVLDEGAAPAHMVEVAMGVDDRVEPVPAPAANGLDHPAAALMVGGVEGHQSVVCPEQDRVGKGLHHRQAVAELGKLVIDAVDRPDARGVNPPLDDGLGHAQQIGHGRVPFPVCVVFPFFDGRGQDRAGRADRSEP